MKVVHSIFAMELDFSRIAYPNFKKQYSGAHIKIETETIKRSHLMLAAH